MRDGPSSVTEPPASSAPGSAQLAVPWPPEPSERGDFYHRTRAFPEEVARWRKALVDRIRAGDSPFPGLKSQQSLDQTRDLLDEGISFLREIARVLAVIHGSPDLGNKKDPV